MRRARAVVALVVGVMSVIPVAADSTPFLGRWNLMSVDQEPPSVYWLEVTEENGALSGKLLNRGGSPLPLQAVSVEGDELIFRPESSGNRPSPEFRARIKGDELVGTVTERDRTVSWVGRRPPTWGDSSANADHALGAPVELFDGRSLDAWDVQHKGEPSGWSVVDGAMTNQAEANNLVSKQTFTDFKIRAEYKVEPESNSGIYLRGRYELQVLDDHGKPIDPGGHMAIYAWEPPRVNASKPAGEWQTMEATLVGNRVTVTLNGQTVHDNAAIQAITGGALDADEAAPGPIMLQGDHGKVWFRRVTVTPITGGK
ncbi:MAG: 3-keto-disaccharide hydrolase [Vicinamibacteraceae bacterium]